MIYISMRDDDLAYTTEENENFSSEQWSDTLRFLIEMETGKHSCSSPLPDREPESDLETEEGLWD